MNIVYDNVGIICKNEKSIRWIHEITITQFEVRNLKIHCSLDLNEIQSSPLFTRLF